MLQFGFEVIKNVPYSAIVFSPPDEFHQSVFFKITYIENGGAEITFASRKSGSDVTKKYTVGDVFIVSPDDRHKYNIDKDEQYRHRDIYVSREIMKECCDIISSGLYRKITEGEYPCFFKISINEIIALGEKLSVFINRKQNKDLDSIHRGIVVSLLTTYCIFKSEKKLYPDWLQDLLRNLDKQEFVRLDFEEIIKSTAFSHSYVSKVFKKYLGISLKQYLINKKLDLSMAMLVNSDKSIESIAVSLGLEYSSSFVKMFKKRYGITPGKCRKELKNKQTSIPFVEWGGQINDNNE